MRKAGKRFARNTCTINPMFALSTAASNMLSKTERVAMDALLEHRATADNVAEISSLIEASIRAIGIARNEGHQHLDPEALEAALKVFNRAAWALRHARARHQTTGVYGLDSSDRAALIQADELVGQMRKPRALQRRIWLLAFKQAYSGHGITLMPLEECSP